MMLINYSGLELFGRHWKLHLLGHKLGNQYSIMPNAFLDNETTMDIFYGLDVNYLYVFRRTT